MFKLDYQSKFFVFIKVAASIPKLCLVQYLVAMLLL